jgi:ribonuclease J
VKYVIHGGEHRIGGMCIEVAAKDGTRILLDLGMPLYDEAGADYQWGTAQRCTTELLEERVLPAVAGRPSGDLRLWEQGHCRHPA